jgi:hypothetical protein
LYKSDTFLKTSKNRFVLRKDSGISSERNKFKSKINYKEEMHDKLRLIKKIYNTGYKSAIFLHSVIF